MKKLFFLLLVFAGFMACENESIQELPQETSVTEDMNTRMGDKIDVCHYDEDYKSWHVINISANAWEGHEKHGDVMLVDEDGDGWVANANECVPGGDCDDDDPNVNPGAEEIVYNGADDDCNPATPDDDLDGDGFPIAEDCDDTNAEVNPGVEEICGNDIDDNCNGEIDEGCETGSCLDYEWGAFLNSIDLTDACRFDYSSGIVLYSNISNGLGCCGLQLDLEFLVWYSGLDNNGKSGEITEEGFQCFLDFLNDNDLPECDFEAESISQPNEKGNFFK